ncbi:MAG: iron-sulfur cluster-binding domain-containing protein, partial [Desulfobacterales bacterium]
KDGELPPIQAGQNISLFLEIDGIRTRRPYSISSPPHLRQYYDITVRRVENGLVSNFLMDDLVIGNDLVSSGPAGYFYFNPLIHPKNMICLAGGSGITPFVSMIREIVECGLDRTVTLFYGNKTTDDIIFHAELGRISARFDSINYIPVIEDPSDDYTGACGFMTAELIKEVLGDLKGKSFFICGPQGMYDFCLPELEGLGIARRKIRQEMYGAPVNIWQYPGWPSEVDPDRFFSVQLKNGQQLKAKAGVPLLVSLEKSGVVVPSLCRSGECSMCRLKVLSGKVFQPAGVPVRKSDRQFGYVHSCAAYPLSDLEILI